METKSPRDTPFICVICNKQISDEWGNNPWPIKQNGRCCDACNLDVVVPSRLRPDLYEKEIRAGKGKNNGNV